MPMPPRFIHIAFFITMHFPTPLIFVAIRYYHFHYADADVDCLSFH